MKKKILLLMGIFSIGFILHAQVGINTQNPQGLFHVDPNADTVGSTNSSDDVIVTNDGKMGVGTVSPRTLLDIQTGGTASAPIPGFRLEDGNEAAGRILSSIDALGTATWQDVNPSVAAQIVRDLTSGVGVGYNDPNYYNTTSYIVLPPGRWALNMVTLISGPTNNQIGGTPTLISATFADDNTVIHDGGLLSLVKSPDLEGGGLVSGICWSHYYNVAVGSVIINNKTAASKKYYYMAGDTSSYGISLPGNFSDVGGPHWGETNIVAFRIPS